jgi:hypothetical protein
MPTCKDFYQSDSEGMVHLEVVVGTPGQSVELVVSWAEVENRTPSGDTGDEVWSDLCGPLRDELLQRAPQGQYEKRDGST